VLLASTGLLISFGLAELLKSTNTGFYC